MILSGIPSLGVLDAQTSPGVLDGDELGQRSFTAVVYSLINSKTFIEHLPIVGTEQCW